MDTQEQARIRAQKQAQRQAGLEARRAMEPAARQAADAAICAQILRSEGYRRAERLLLYAATGGEVDLSAVAAQARRDGKRVAWPVCLPGHRMAAAEPQGAGAWRVGAYGIPAPVLERSCLLAPESLELVLVPCAAFDRRCRRIGMGGGYYDRYLPLCTGARVWGVAYECQLVPEAAAETHDRPMDAYVTERRILWND